MTAVQEKTKKTGARRLFGKVALVTGGSRGIGKAIALRLAAEGATVAVNYNNNKSSAEKVVALAGELGVKAEAFKADVSSKEDSKRLIEEVTQSLGRIDILVNNAGVGELKPIDEIDAEHYERLFSVNVEGLINTTFAAVKTMRDGGRIINISSIAAEGNFTGASVYSATKGAVDTLSRAWAQELGKRGITVNSVAPGFTVTDMLMQGLTEELKQFAISRTALGRLGEAEDIADAVAFFASDDSRWVTGQVLRCDGGLTL
jgi:3-oxoacyl-[acyl-carrier protein] reductase